MPSEKPAHFVPYKFRDLKVHGSPEWLAGSQKKYRRVFGKEELKQIFVEFSFFNKLFDEKDWEVQTGLKVFQLGKEKRTLLHEFEEEVLVAKEQNIVFVREGWPVSDQPHEWETGTYQWEGLLNGEVIANMTFYVVPQRWPEGEENPFFRLTSVMLYESNAEDRYQEKPTFRNIFDYKSTRFIFVEFQGLNKLEVEWMCELTFNFYNDARQLKGRTTELVKIKSGTEGIRIISGWGSNFPGTWFQDRYTLEVVFMDQLVCAVPFEVSNYYSNGNPELLIPKDDGLLRQAPTDGTGGGPLRSKEELFQELNGLIGLAPVKSRVQEYAQYLNFLKIRKEKGIQEESQLNLHAVFTGNPGTGKTTVARLLGKLYHSMGLLSKGHVLEVDRADLIGEYIGQTAPRVKEAIDRARGGILFIDEAYSLSRTENDKKDYGLEAIEILVREMSSTNGDLAVVVAGYPKEMEQMLTANPGFKSRFNITLSFPDYTPKELTKIAGYAAEQRGVTLADPAQELLYKQLVKAYRERDKSFGNARLVYSLVDEAKMNLGLRLMQRSDVDELTLEDLSRIEVTDLEKIFEKKDAAQVHIPIDEPLLKEALDELQGLVGLESVKKEVLDLVKLVRFYRESGKDVLNRFSLHSVFTGNPGTGKTTVARLLGKLYKALGILERGRVVEVDRRQLIAGYTGQTAEKTAKVIEEAKGSVLFIDEAYALVSGHQGDFGQEAIDTLLKRMEDLRGSFIVIVAGYPSNMKRFLEANPGLKSRFDHWFKFEDYQPEDLLQIARYLLKQEGLQADEPALAHLDAYFTHLYRTRNKFFGNARAIRKIIEKSVKNQHLRLASLPVDQRTESALQQLTLADVQEFGSNNDNLLDSGNQGRIGF
ncbi:MAG: AAA family ATPase [Bacteroidota bacterium]